MSSQWIRYTSSPLTVENIGAEQIGRGRQKVRSPVRYMPVAEFLDAGLTKLNAERGFFGDGSPSLRNSRPSHRVFFLLT
jgi:hypothetical protein